MSCENTCTSTEVKFPKLDLGCVDHCCEIKLGFNAPEDGVYTLRYSIAGNPYVEHLFFAAGDEFEINTSCLNESADTSLEIYNVDGELIEFEDGDCTYSGITFQVEIINRK